MASELETAARTLAMLGLQSQRYVDDPDYKDAVDAVLYMTVMKSFKDAPQCTTMIHPGTERTASQCVLRKGHDGKCQPTKSQPRTLESDIAEDR